MVVRERFGKEKRIKSKKIMQGLYCSGSCYCYFASTVYVCTNAGLSAKLEGLFWCLDWPSQSSTQ